MFKQKLIPKLCEEEQHIIDYTFVKSPICECNICSSKTNIMYTTYMIDDKKCTKTCYLCHIIMNFKKYHINKVFLIETECSQFEIVNNILTYYNDYKQIPNLNMIDKKCKLIKNINIHEYIKNYEKYPTIKIYFNPNVLTHLTDLTQNMFCKKQLEDDTNISNYAYVVKFYDDMQNIKKSNIFSKQLSTLNDMKEIDLSFEKKYKKNQLIDKIKLSLL